MKDTCKPMRKALFTCINGNITYAGNVVKLYDGKVFTGEAPNLYMYFGTQQEQDITEQDCAWQTKNRTEIVIVSKTGSEVSKDSIDDISQRIYDLVLTLPGNNLLAVQNGFQILELRRESAVIGNVQISPTQSELQKVLSLTASIIHL